MIKLGNVQVKLEKYKDGTSNFEYDLDRVIYDLDSQIDLLSSQEDKTDYILSIASGLLCGTLDILWMGEFSLERCCDFTPEKIESFVCKSANMVGYRGDDINGAVKHLEKKYQLPSDGNTPDFGGGLQHHLRDFAHHPTIVGLVFSLLTQFTYKSYGTDTQGNFIVMDIVEKSREHIGQDLASKIANGTITWFLHLISDVAGSSSTLGKSSGTGIPGPLLSLAKEISALLIYKNINEEHNCLSKYSSKLFNGSLFARRDKSGNIIKDTQLRFDLRRETDLGMDIGRQAIPFVANDTFVRCFYFIRHLASEMKKQDIKSFSEMNKIDWDKVKPTNNPTIARMITIATSVFTTVDIGRDVVSSNYWISVNYIGVGRFALAIKEDVAWNLKIRDINKIKEMYKEINYYGDNQKK